MANNYQWEFGIDWDMHRPDGKDHRYLQAGLAWIPKLYDQNNGKPASPNVIRRNQDTLSIYIFDNTAGGSKTQSIDKVEILITKTDGSAVATDDFIQGGLASGKYPSYSELVSSYLAPGSLLPCWGIDKGGTKIIAQRGRYLMTVKVKATHIDGSKEDWKVDPEMIVSEGGNIDPTKPTQQ